MTGELTSLERQVGAYLERIVEATIPSVVSAYETKIAKLEERKLLIHEQMVSLGRPRSSFEDTVRTAMSFLANPWNLLENRAPPQP